MKIALDKIPGFNKLSPVLRNNPKLAVVIILILMKPSPTQEPSLRFVILLILENVLFFYPCSSFLFSF